MNDTAPPIAPQTDIFVAVEEETYPATTWRLIVDDAPRSGAAGIPTLGFGPQEERYVHAADDQVDLAKLTKAAAFYALFPLMFMNGEGDEIDRGFGG